MMNDATETDARIHIDQMLRQAGWDPADKRMVRTEVPVSLDDISSEIRDYSLLQSAPRKADYVLYAVNGRPLAVVEAKKSAIDPYRSKD